LVRLGAVILGGFYRLVAAGPPAARHFRTGATKAYYILKPMEGPAPAGP
jgi:hypothetical protein